MSEPQKHDLHDFMSQAADEMASEYSRIYRRAAGDPGTAGDEGEENWAELLRGWIPDGYHVRTKGQIINHHGELSPQVDVLVLRPNYPPKLLGKKKYLAAGVAACFECKNTLTAKHVKEAVENGVIIKNITEPRGGTPYKELTSPIFYGLLAHSHSWKGEKSRPEENIKKALSKQDDELVKHPREQIDVVCVADLAWWHLVKITHVPHDVLALPKKSVFDSISCGHIAHTRQEPEQEDDFMPVGGLISFLLRRLAWEDPAMRGIAEYFEETDLEGVGSGKTRNWSIREYSDEVRAGIWNEELGRDGRWSEWPTIIA